MGEIGRQPGIIRSGGRDHRVQHLLGFGRRQVVADFIQDQQGAWLRELPQQALKHDIDQLLRESHIERAPDEQQT